MKTIILAIIAVAILYGVYRVLSFLFWPLLIIGIVYFVFFRNKK